MKIGCEVEYIELEGDHGNGVDSVRVTCSKCGHYTESYGVYEDSIKRCCALLNDECPEMENNYYVAVE